MRITACLLFVLLAGCSGMKDAPPKEAPKADKKAPDALSTDILKVDLKTFWETYEKNPIKADTLWKGKTIELTFTVRRINSDSLGAFDVEAGGDVSAARFARMSDLEKKRFQHGYPPALVCQIDPAFKAEFVDAEKGKPYTVIGRCAGRRDDPETLYGYVITLEQCRSVPQKPPSAATLPVEKKPLPEEKLLPDPKVP